MIPDPRYIGDIRTPHLSTPRRASRALALVRRTVAQQKKKIATLQKTVGRYKQRISTLKGVVSDLKKRNLISEIGAENLMVRFQPNVRKRATCTQRARQRNTDINVDICYGI